MEEERSFVVQDPVCQRHLGRGVRNVSLVEVHIDMAEENGAVDAQEGGCFGWCAAVVAVGG